MTHKEHLIDYYKRDWLNDKGKNTLIDLLLNENRALDKAIGEMKKVPQEYNPKVKMNGYKKKKKVIV